MQLTFPSIRILWASAVIKQPQWDIQLNWSRILKSPSRLAKRFAHSPPHRTRELHLRAGACAWAIPGSRKDTFWHWEAPKSHSHQAGGSYKLTAMLWHGESSHVQESRNPTQHHVARHDSGRQHSWHKWLSWDRVFWPHQAPTRRGSSLIHCARKALWGTRDRKALQQFNM